MDNSQKLIIEVEGPENKIQELLEKWEAEVEKDEDLEIKAVTLRKD
jgi:hypothetical protein